MEKGLYIRGRYFSLEEIEQIKECVLENFSFGRTFISKDLCIKLNWRQPNGWLKDRACRDVLRRLEDLNIIKLPKARIKSSSTIRNKKYEHIIGSYDYDYINIDTISSDIDLIFVKGSKKEELWNTIVDKYHYLGYQVSVGRTIKYLITHNMTILGAISFNSASWHISDRDSLLENLGISNPHDQVINNNRFLILPNSMIKNLASLVLSKATKRIIQDWADYYSITPLIAETFVEPKRFAGTCYKAANWIEIGVTKGFAKKGTSFYHNKTPKMIFLYGLSKELRKRIGALVKGEKIE